MSETETRPRRKVFDSETRPRLSKSGLETKTNTTTLTILPRGYIIVDCTLEDRNLLSQYLYF